ncbi:MAG: 2Fe-2S iron-sulfur cluster-binding protein, partial [Pseudomonadota bacterium]
MSTRLQTGGRLLDRTKPVSFTFNGKRLKGYEGDTLASALLANGQMLMGRSFKYHRPRSVVTA